MATQKQNKTYVGTELKMHIGFSYPAYPSITLLTIDFKTFFYADDESKGLEFSKSQHIVEGGEYYAPVDTTVTGPGVLKMKLTAYIPDSSFDDKHRTEVGVCTTNVIIE